VPFDPLYSISKAAAFSLSQSLHALLAGRGVSVHIVLPGPIDTDMTRNLDIPKASPESTARAILVVQVRRGEAGTPSVDLDACRLEFEGESQRDRVEGSLRRAVKGAEALCSRKRAVLVQIGYLENTAKNFVGRLTTIDYNFLSARFRSFPS